MFNNPLTQIGLGILSRGGPGISGAQQIGQGGLLGIQSYNRTVNAQELAERQRQAALLQQQELKLRQQRMMMEQEAAQRQQNALQAQQEWIAREHPELVNAPAEVQRLAYEKAYGAPQQQSFGGTPLYFNTPEGPKLGRFAPGGGVYFPQLPAGTAPALPTQTVNLGSQIGVIPRGATTPTEYLPVELKPGERPEIKRQQAAASEAGKVAGAAQAEAALELPGAALDVADVKQKIEELRTHPGLKWRTGIVGALTPPIPGTAGADFESRKQQILGGAFLTAYQQLKGGGAITEVEGLKAEQAVNRMQAAQSEPAFLAALKDYENAVDRGFEKLRLKAGTGWSIKKVGD